MVRPGRIPLLMGLLTLAACEQSPTASVDDAVLTAATSPKSTGKPEVFTDQFSFDDVVQCQTFDMKVEDEGRVKVWNWFNADGSFRGKSHFMGSTRYTNLSTGEFLVVDAVFNDSFVDDGSGQIQLTSSGAHLKVRREGKGRQIAYQMGRILITIDFSGFPPSFEFSFTGREDFGGGPCVDLGDPPPPF